MLNYSNNNNIFEKLETRVIGNIQRMFAVKKASSKNTNSYKIT